MNSISLICEKNNSHLKILVNYLGSEGENLFQEIIPSPSALELRALLKRPKLNIDKHVKNELFLHIKNELQEFNFSKRQMQIADALLRGHSYSRIASSLNLSQRTIENYVENIKNKVSVNSKNEIIDLLESKADFFHLYQELL